MTLEASELCGYFSNFHLPTIRQSFPGCWLGWLTNLVRLTLSGAFTVQFRNFNVKDRIIPCPFTFVFPEQCPKQKGGIGLGYLPGTPWILREKTVGSRSTWFGKPPFNLKFCFRMRMSRASQSVLVSTPREGWFGSILPYPRVMRRVEGAGEPVSRQSGSAKVLAVTRLLLVTSTGHFFGRCKSQLHRSLSLLLGLRQLQGLLLRQRSHCQVWLVLCWDLNDKKRVFPCFSSIKNGASKVPGTSALRWAFHRLKRKSRFPSRLPMRHVSRASMVWHWEKPCFKHQKRALQVLIFRWLDHETSLIF